MKHNQEYTPKYWVGHDPRTDDIYIDTARKSKGEAEAALKKLLMCNEDEYSKFIENGEIDVIIIEIRMLEI